MLSTELIYMIFDYLSFDDILTAFFTNEKPLNDAISAYPASIDLSKVSARDSLLHRIFHCRSLKVFGDDRRQLEMIQTRLNVQALRAITFTNVSLFTLVAVVNELPMQQIESISITKIKWRNVIPKLDQEAWLSILSAGCYRLRYLHVPVEICFWNAKKLSFNLPTLENVTFEHISINKMLALICHMPNLRYLKGCLCLPVKGVDKSDLIMTKLSHLCLNIENLCTFECFHQLSTICPNVTHFNLQLRVSVEDPKMTDPTEWQKFIGKSLPNLVYLRLRLGLSLSTRCFDKIDLQEFFDSNQYASTKTSFPSHCRKSKAFRQYTCFSMTTSIT